MFSESEEKKSNHMFESSERRLCHRLFHPSKSVVKQKIKRTNTHSSLVFSFNLLQFLNCLHSSFADVVLDREFGHRLSSLKIGKDLVLDMV